MTEEDKKRLEEIRAYQPHDELGGSVAFLLARLDEVHAALDRAKQDHRDMEAWGQDNLKYAAKLREALRFYGGTTDEGGLAFMPNTIGGFSATESKPGERARKALGEE